MSNTQYATSSAMPWVSASAPLARLKAPAWKVRATQGLVVADVMAVGIATVMTFVAVDLSQPVELPGLPRMGMEAFASILIVCWSVALGLGGCRSVRVLGAGLEEYRRTLRVSLQFFGIIAIIGFILGAAIPRALFTLVLPLGLGILVLVRWLCRRWLVATRARGGALSPTLLVGSATEVTSLLADLRRRSDIGYRAVGVCILGGDWSENFGLFPSVQNHSPHHLAQAATDGGYSAVMVAGGLDNAGIRALAWALENSQTELILLPRLADIAGPRLRVSDVEGLSLVHVDLPRFSGLKLWLKRSFDVAFSAFALVLLIPIWLIVAILIKLDDGGPVLFAQERIGLRGEPFRIWKFRTMCVDAEARIDALIHASGGGALLFKLEDDPRITRLGRVLRKYSIDELPQFWSVLCGGMSVVGPRPQVAREVAEYSEIHHRRLLIKPGITGLWQVNGRSQLSLDESIRLDLRYVENWSLIGDITIILKTIRVVLLPSGAF